MGLPNGGPEPGAAFGGIQLDQFVASLEQLLGCGRNSGEFNARSTDATDRAGARLARATRSGNHRSSQQVRSARLR